MLTGCAGYRPILVGEGCVAVGMFRPLVRLNHPEISADGYEGVGVLVGSCKLMVGYTRVQIVSVNPSASLVMETGPLNLAHGVCAERPARTMPQGSRPVDRAGQSSSRKDAIWLTE